MPQSLLAVLLTFGSSATGCAQEKERCIHHLNIGLQLQPLRGCHDQQLRTGMPVRGLLGGQPRVRDAMRAWSALPPSWQFPTISSLPAHMAAEAFREGAPIRCALHDCAFFDFRHVPTTVDLPFLAGDPLS